MSRLSLGLVILLTAGVATATSDENDSATLVEKVLKYQPNIPVSGVAAGAYAVAATMLFTLLFRWKNWWGLCLPIGAALESLGFILRIMLIKNPNNLPLFVGMQLFIVCSPAAFLAFNYILFGRLVRDCIGRQHALLRPEIVSTVFVISDIATFLVQSAGGSMEIMKSLANVGQKIWLVGLILQASSYFVFCFLLLHIHWKIRKDDTMTGAEKWRKVLWALDISSFFIVIRCIYRIAELAQDGGLLMTHEMYFYLMDVLSLLNAICVYIPFWPGRFITKSGDHDSEMTQSGPI